MPVRIKKMLKELKRGFARLYGEQLKAVYLYGSYARGEARLDSDIDVLMVINGDFDYIDMLKRSDDFAASYCLEKDVVISRAFVSEREFREKLSPFLINVRREAVAV